VFEIDHENPLHRNKSVKLTVKIRDFCENGPFQNPGDAPDEGVIPLQSGSESDWLQPNQQIDICTKTICF
jgi:hypothetical protein